ncbi:hypothetical protein BHE74_00024424 [Ensete ventricosum]|nr:hypothetical protein BHE74_00024424 [Ensete ventricosum]
MTAPNIQMISAFLRSCDLGRGGTARLVEASDESAGEVTVELNSETVLPCHWEQCLDMRSGQVYYINRETGTRTTKDPRTAAAAASSYSSSYQSKQDSSSDDSCSEIGGSDDDSVDTANSCLTTLSSASSEDTAAAAGGSQSLVSAGCRSCFMYFMVPKSVDACPKSAAVISSEPSAADLHTHRKRKRSSVSDQFARLTDLILREIENGDGAVVKDRQWRRYKIAPSWGQIGRIQKRKRPRRWNRCSPDGGDHVPQELRIHPGDGAQLGALNPPKETLNYRKRLTCDADAFGGAGTDPKRGTRGDRGVTPLGTCSRVEETVRDGSKTEGG